MVLKYVFGALAALVVSTNPAMANETAAATQITGAIDAANANTASGDREFQELFASWKSMDQTGVIGAGPAARVSVPSGMPVQSSLLTSSFGMRIHPVLGGRRGHNGVDLAQPTGTPVYATADGLVSKAERYSSYGNYIQIEHGGALQTRYAHLSGYAVAAGEEVKKGQLIGYVGSTGRSTGPHLHYEVRVAGEAVDPTPYMAETRLAVSNDTTLGRGGPE